jgi:chromosome segregation ATPase
MSSTDTLFRSKFDELRTRKAEIEAQLAPHRDAVSALVITIAPLQAQIDEHKAEIRRITEESGLFDLDNDIARLARELNPRVMAERRAGAESLDQQD